MMKDNAGVNLAMIKTYLNHNYQYYQYILPNKCEWMHQIAKCKNLKEVRVIQPFPRTFGPLPFLLYITALLCKSN